MEQTHRSTLADHVDRDARLELRVLISESWYYAFKIEAPTFRLADSYLPREQFRIRHLFDDGKRNAIANKSHYRA
jgi:hypothetical protein